MKVSFNLDDVLFVSEQGYETEPELEFPLNRLFPERLRKGSVELINELQKRGFSTLIYTSSFKTPIYLDALFKHHNIYFDQVINSYNPEDEKTISLHIDSVNNSQEIESPDLKVFKLSGPDNDWVQKVLDEAERIKNEL